MPEPALIEMTKEQLLARVSDGKTTVEDLRDVVEQYAYSDDTHAVEFCTNVIEALEVLGVL